MRGRLVEFVSFMKEEATAVVVDGVVDLVAVCDLAQSGARVVDELRLVRPRVVVGAGASLKLRNVRHPVIQGLTRTQ